MAEKTVLIIANGVCPPAEQLHDLAQNADRIIAADGGSSHLIGSGIVPDVIIGDFDSLASEAREAFPNSKFIHLDDQNTTDLQKALHYAVTLKPETIHVLGVSGARSDHFLGNILALNQFSETIRLVFHDEFGALEKITGEVSVDERPGTTVSLISFSSVSGITLRGFRYPLSDSAFPSGFNGVSNVVERKPATIRITSGSLLLYILRD